MSAPRPAALLAPLLLVAACDAPLAADGQGAPRAPNILLVSMDTCRYDHLGLAGYQRDTSPNLDALAARGTSFANCYAQSNETLYSHASIFSARHPGDLAALDDDFALPSDVRTLAELLELYGYDTAAFTAGAHMRRAFGLSRGFDLYLDDVDFGSFFHSMQAASFWLEDQPATQPFFLFVHGYDCHSPYSKPLFFEDLFDPEYSGVADEIAQQRVGIEHIYDGRYYPEVPLNFVINSRGQRFITDDFFEGALRRAADNDAPSTSLSQADLDHLVAHYDGSIVYADLFLGLFLARLDELGLGDDTVVAVFSDHGEGLADHEHFHHRPLLNDSVLHVPLVLYVPGEHGRNRGEITHRVNAMDIAPTLLELAGVPALQGVPGQSLVPLLEQVEAPAQAPQFAESRHLVSVRVPGEQLIASKVALARGLPEGEHSEGYEHHLFPGELSDAEPVGAAALALRLAGWYEGIQPQPGASPLQVDEQLRRVLQERGYW